MQVRISEEVLASLFDFPHKCKIEQLGGGLINHSYQVSCNGQAILLQKINKKVFSSPSDVQNNYITLWQYTEFEMADVELPRPLYFKRSKPLFKDSNGEYWRAFQYISDSHTPSVAQKESQVKNTAKIFGSFTAAFEDFDLNELKVVIPGFHDLSRRYNQFEQAIQSEEYERISKSLQMIEELKKRERYKNFYEVMMESEEFPQRVMHHDAKITNVLFNQRGKVICPIDFDTAMPGYFFSDLGDMIRTMSCSVDENSTEFNKISIRKRFYKAIIEGYLKVMEPILTKSEKKYIHYAGLLMTYMQALRFLTDYLNNDKYYKVSYREQNFDRAKNQLTLLIKLEEFLKKEFKMNP